jgi:hypothetical protein
MLEPARVEQFKALSSKAGPRLSLKGLPETNTLAWMDSPLVMTKKSFVTLSKKKFSADSFSSSTNEIKNRLCLNGSAYQQTLAEETKETVAEFSTVKAAGWARRAQ